MALFLLPFQAFCVSAYLFSSCIYLIDYLNHDLIIPPFVDFVNTFFTILQKKLQKVDFCDIILCKKRSEIL